MGADITAEWNSAFPMARTPPGAVQLYTVEHIATSELQSAAGSFWIHSGQNHGRTRGVTRQNPRFERGRSNPETKLKLINILNSHTNLRMSLSFEVAQKKRKNK